MNSNAIVILYNGKQPSVEVIEKICGIIVGCGVAMPEFLEIKHFDSNSIANAIIAKVADKERIQVVNEQPSDIENALIFVSEKFNTSSLYGTRKNSFVDMLHFMDNVRNAVIIAQTSPYEDENAALLNAIEIISKNKDTISRALREKYKISSQVIQVINEIYKSL